MKIEIEEKLIRMKKLSEKVKVLTAELKQLQKEVISHYFVDQEEFKTERGLILATYTSYKSWKFDITKFKKDKPDVYDLYLDLKLVNKFSLK